MPVCSHCGQENPEIARFCLACGQPLGPVAAHPVQERKLVTALFADVIGSTGLGEQLDAEELEQVMSAWFRAMRSEIEARQGTVEKFIGDAVMAVFGVPQAHEDDVDRALEAALAMRERLRELNADLGRGHGIALEMRIGVNTGEVMAVGEPRPGEALATGDAVNAASRLEQLAEPGQILVAERTARAARGFLLDEVGGLELRGRNEPLRAFALVGAGVLEERGVVGLRAPIVGRDRELALLHALYERVVAEGRPHLATIYADPGIGKSRLVREFAALAECGSAPPRLLVGRCLPYGDGITYWPLAEILKAVAGVLDSDSAEVALERIQATATRRLTPEVAPDPHRSAAALAYSLGVDDPSTDLAGLPPRHVRLETHAAWRSFFSALAAEQPVLAVVEDIHWADGALLDLLEELAERVQGPVLFVCPARPELTGHRPTWGGGRRSFSSVFLEPLTDEGARELVGHLLDIDELPAGARRRILDRAEGNPFFLEEIIRHLIDEGRLVRSGDRWRASSDIAQLRLPDTVQAVLAARIDLLAPAEKRVLQQAAVVGRVFWTGPVQALLGDGEAELHAAMRRLEERELVYARLGSAFAGQEEYIFKHILTRDVAYGTLPRRERGAAHARVAEWIETSAADRRGELVDLLAHHYAEAYRSATPGDPERLRAKAFDYLLLATRAALSQGALARSRRLAEQALGFARAPLERATALEALARGYQAESMGDDAWRHYTEAVDVRLASVPDDREAIALDCGRALEVAARWTGTMRHIPPEAEARRYLEVGLGSVPEGDSEALVRLLTAEAFWNHAYVDGAGPAVDRSQAREAGERAAEIALRLGRPELALAALDAVENAHNENGFYEAARQVSLRRRELVSKTHDADEIGDTYAMAAWSEHHVGRYREARDMGDEGYRRVVAEAPLVAAHALTWRAVSRFRLGDWDGLLADLALVQDLLGDRRDRPVSGLARPWPTSAFVQEARGEPAVADRLLTAVLEIEKDRGSFSAVHSPWFARTLLLRGDLGSARERLEATLPSRNRTAYGHLLEARCELVAASRAWEEVGPVAREARRYADEAGTAALQPYADRLDGRTALAAGDAVAALPLLDRAASSFRELGDLMELASTTLWVADTLATLGRADDARALLGEARRELERLGYRHELERADAVAARLE